MTPGFLCSSNTSQNSKPFDWLILLVFQKHQLSRFSQPGNLVGFTGIRRTETAKNYILYLGLFCYPNTIKPFEAIYRLQFCHSSQSDALVGGTEPARFWLSDLTHWPFNLQPTLPLTEGLKFWKIVFKKDGTFWNSSIFKCSSVQYCVRPGTANSPSVYHGQCMVFSYFVIV